MEWPLSREEVTLFYSPAGLAVVAPLPDDRVRIVTAVDDAPEVPSGENLQSLLDARGMPATSTMWPEAPGSTFTTVWSIAHGSAGSCRVATQRTCTVQLAGGHEHGHPFRLPGQPDLG
jgi:hypothetical protein